MERFTVFIIFLGLDTFLAGEVLLTTKAQMTPKRPRELHPAG
jgi:hypothetical protein